MVSQFLNLEHIYVETLDSMHRISRSTNQPWASHSLHPFYSPAARMRHSDIARSYPWLAEPRCRACVSDIGIYWAGFARSICPTGRVGRGCNPVADHETTPHLDSSPKARRTRLAVSLTRTAIFSSRERMVENSALYTRDRLSCS